MGISLLGGRTVKVGLFVVLMLGALAVVVAFARDQSPPEHGVRIRAETLVPADGLVFATDGRCPASPAPTPRQWSLTSSLADELPLDEGEIIAVRLSAAPYVGSLPESIEFSVEWPTGTIDRSGPVCAFVVDDGDGADLRWSWDDDAQRASFALSSMRPFATVDVEVWLVAARPVGVTLFSSRIFSAPSENALLIEPLPGVVSLEQRSTADVRLELVEVAERMDGASFDLTAVVSNNETDRLALDVTLEIRAGPGIDWTVLDDRCDGGQIVTCILGDLDDGGARVTASATTTPGWRGSFSVECPDTTAVGELGVCVTATAATNGLADPTTARTFVVYDLPADEELLVGIVDPPAVAQRGSDAVVTVFVESRVSRDLGRLDVVGSDCDSLARVPGPVDDGDNFLERGEEWWYECLVPSRANRAFRFDVAATGSDGVIASQSFTGVLTVIEPLMVVETYADGEHLGVTVINGGDGDLEDVAVAPTDCISSAPAEALHKLPEGAVVEFTCSGGIETVDVVVFATDLAGDVVIARPTP